MKKSMVFLLFLLTVIIVGIVSSELSPVISMRNGDTLHYCLSTKMVSECTRLSEDETLCNNDITKRCPEGWNSELFSKTIYDGKYVRDIQCNYTIDINHVACITVGNEDDIWDCTRRPITTEEEPRVIEPIDLP